MQKVAPSQEAALFKKWASYGDYSLTEELVRKYDAKYGFHDGECVSLAARCKSSVEADAIIDRDWPKLIRLAKVDKFDPANLSALSLLISDSVTYDCDKEEALRFYNMYKRMYGR